MFSKKDSIFDKFWVPNRSRHKLKDFRVKNIVFFAFLQFPSGELEKKCHFRTEAPRGWTVKNDQNGPHVGSQNVGALDLDGKHKNTPSAKLHDFGPKKKSKRVK